MTGSIVGSATWEAHTYCAQKAVQFICETIFQRSINVFGAEQSNSFESTDIVDIILALKTTIKKELNHSTMSDISV